MTAEELEKEAALKLLRQGVGRVMTNVVKPAIYEGHALDFIKSPLKAIKAVVADVPMYTSGQGGGRELPYRRMFDLPARFGSDRYTKAGPGKFKFSDQFSGQMSQNDVVRPRRLLGAGDSLDNAYHPVMGNYDRTPLPDGSVAYKDRWDFDLNPGEKPWGSPTNAIRWALSKITKPVTIEGIAKQSTMNHTDKLHLVFCKEAARLMKHLAALAPAAQQAAVKALPSSLRSTAAYKLMGREAAEVTAKIPNHDGHGAEHIFNVTRNVQKLMAPQPGQVAVTQAQRRVGTIGALMHDVGRAAENPVVARTGQKISDLSPHYWHSESGGRYAQHWIKKNPLSRHVPELKDNVKNLIRVHDTDAHAKFPELAKKFLDDPSQIANRTVYAADKIDGMGLGGVVRTGRTGAGYGQTVDQSVAYGRKNIDKYQRVIQNYTNPSQHPRLMNELNTYEKGLSAMGQHQAVPDSAQELSSWIPKTNVTSMPPPLQKAAGLRSQPYLKLFNQVMGKTMQPEQFRRIMRHVEERSLVQPPTTPMRDALAKMNITPETREMFMSSIRARHEPAPSSVMNAILPP